MAETANLKLILTERNPDANLSFKDWRMIINGFDSKKSNMEIIDDVIGNPTELTHRGLSENLVGAIVDVYIELQGTQSDIGDLSSMSALGENIVEAINGVDHLVKTLNTDYGNLDEKVFELQEKTQISYDAATETLTFGG